MKKKLLAALLSLTLLGSLCVGTAFAEEAAPTSDSLLCDGVLQTPTVYKINGSNYFKIRDLAAILNGTAKQFSVGYDGEKKSVTADTGTGYVKQPTDLTGAPAGGNKTATASSDAIYINGVLCQAEVYKIDGMNYFKLRDLGQALDFGVGWDGATGTVTLDTTRGYETQTPTAPAISDQELMKLAETAANNMGNMSFELAAGRFLQLDMNDSISAVEVLGDGFGDVRAHRIIGCTTITEVEAQMREAWYQVYSRKYPTFEFDGDSWMWMDRGGKIYFIENFGMGDRPGCVVIDRIISRTDDEAVFSGRWVYGDDDSISDTFEMSLVLEDGTWKYGYYKE